MPQESHTLVRISTEQDEGALAGTATAVAVALAGRCACRGWPLRSWGAWTALDCRLSPPATRRTFQFAAPPSPHWRAEWLRVMRRGPHRPISGSDSGTAVVMVGVIAAGAGRYGSAPRAVAAGCGRSQGIYLGQRTTSRGGRSRRQWSRGDRPNPFQMHAEAFGARMHFGVPMVHGVPNPPGPSAAVRPDQPGAAWRRVLTREGQRGCHTLRRFPILIRAPLPLRVASPAPCRHLALARTWRRLGGGGAGRGSLASNCKTSHPPPALGTPHQ